MIRNYFLYLKIPLAGFLKIIQHYIYSFTNLILDARDKCIIKTFPEVFK